MKCICYVPLDRDSELVSVSDFPLSGCGLRSQNMVISVIVSTLRAGTQNLVDLFLSIPL